MTDQREETRLVDSCVYGALAAESLGGIHAIGVQFNHASPVYIINPKFAIKLGWYFVHRGIRETISNVLRGVK